MRAVVRAFVLILLAFIAGSAGAVDQPVAGRRLAVRQSSTSERLVFVARDLGVAAPRRGQLDDPTLTGAVVHFGNPDTGEWARFDLEPRGWSERGRARLQVQ